MKKFDETKEKLVAKKDDGFTLAELLIVVAIIAVLAIIAIPIFSSKLENSREETDIANIRSAKAAAVSLYLGGKDLDGNSFSDTDAEMYFDAVSGELVKDSTDITAYGRGTKTDGGCDTFNMVVNPDTNNHKQSTYATDTEAAGSILKVTINETGTIALSWVEP